MTRLSAAAVATSLLGAAVVLVDVVVITVVDGSFGVPDEALWTAFLLLAPTALVLAALALARRGRHRWLAAVVVLVLLVVALVVLVVAGQALSDAVYDGTNRGLTWEAGNYVAGVALLGLAALVAGHDRRTRA